MSLGLYSCFFSAGLASGLIPPIIPLTYVVTAVAADVPEAHKIKRDDEWFTKRAKIRGTYYAGLALGLTTLTVVSAKITLWAFRKVRGN